MRAPIWRGRIENGVFKLDNRDGFKKYMEGFEGKKIEIVLRERTVSGSDQQKKYYFAVVVSMIADYLGYTKLEAHETLKEHFGIASTTKLSTQEFQDYINQVVRWAAIEFSLNIPEPDGVEY